VIRTGWLSERARRAVERPSAIREIMSLVADYKRHPEKYPRRLIYMAGGWPQDPPPEFLREALVEVAEREFASTAGYPPTRGDPEFVDALAAYEREVFGRTVESEEILSGLGSTALTGALFLALLDEGSELILASPAYLNYERQVSVEVGRVRIRRWPILREGRFDPDLEELKEMVTENTRAILISTPGNPDGQVFSDEQLRAVSDLAEDRGVWLLIDVAYRAFHYDGSPRYLSRERRDHEVWICSLSKELRIPGWRVGYVYADPGLIRALETIEQARTLAPCRPIQRAIARMVESVDPGELRRYLLEYTPRKYGKVASYTAELLGSVEGLRILEPAGGFYVFFSIEELGVGSKEFSDGLLRGYQVAVVPGRDFGAEGWIRASFAPLVEEVELIEEGVERMREYVSSLLQRG